MSSIATPRVLQPFFPEDRLGRWAVAALYAGAFVAPLSISLGQVFQLVLLIIGAVFVKRHWTCLRSTALIWLPVAFAAFVILRSAVAAWIERPDLAASHWDEMTTWMKTAIVPIMIYGLALAATGNWQRHGLVTGGMLLLGYCVYLLVHISPSEMLAALQTSGRYNMELGFRSSAIKLPAIITALVLTTTWLLAAFTQSGPGRRRILLAGSGIVALGLLAFFVAAIIATKSRNGWLTLLIMLAAALLLALWAYRGELHRIRGTMLAAAAAIIVMVGALASFSWEPISDRWAQTADSIQQTAKLPFQGSVEELERDSVGVRVVYWAFGWERFLDRPLVGRGAADQRHLTDEFPIPPQLEDRGDTYHNSHIDILLRFGLIGYLMIAAFTGLLVLAAWRMLREPGIPRLAGLYTLAFLPGLAFWAMNAQILHRYTVEHFYGPILALSFAFAISKMLASRSP